MVSDIPENAGFQPLELAPPPPGQQPTVGPLPPGSTQLQQDSPLGALLNIPADINSVVNLIEKVLPDVFQAVGTASAEVVLGVSAVLSGAGKGWIKFFQWESHVSLWDWLKGTTEQTFIEPMLNHGLGIKSPPDGSQAKRGLIAVDSIVSFAIVTQFVVAAINHGGKLLLGNRWSESLGETLAKVPEEAGLSWALGIVISGAFEAAFGESLNNYIRSQTRPNKPEWMIARSMLRQHVIDDADLEEILQDAGFPEKWIHAIKKLETQPLPVGDVQALFQQGLINDEGIDSLMKAQGFSDENRHLLKELYITKAETATGAEIRSVWRQLFRDGLVSEAEYRKTLEDVHFPQRLIDGDVEAVLDEKKYGWRLQSVAVIKSAYLHAPGTQDIAVSKLQGVGYSHDDAMAMVNSWTAPPIRRTHGLTQAQVMKYLIAGVLSEDQARTQLMALGLDTTATDFLLAHPTTASGAHVVKLTPALITQAYINGAITQSEIKPALEKAGASGDALEYLYRNALEKSAHHHGSGSGQLPLSEGHIVSAFRYGIYDQPTATLALESLGYSEPNAAIILEIANKGEFRPPQPPPFASVEAAMAYLVGLGLTFDSPISPIYEAALMMVEMAGYIPHIPANFKPPTQSGLGSLPPPYHPGLPGPSPGTP